MRDRETFWESVRQDKMFASFLRGALHPPLWQSSASVALSREAGLSWCFSLSVATWTISNWSTTPGMQGDQLVDVMGRFI